MVFAPVRTLLGRIIDKLVYNKSLISEEMFYFF